MGVDGVASHAMTYSALPEPMLARTTYDLRDETAVSNYLERESLFEIVQASESPPPLVGEQIHERVSVSIDALWH